MKLENLQTPVIIVDEDIFNENAKAMAKILDGKKMRLRPHFKSHKCADIARLQMENGAVGITCAKLSEAKDLVDSGIENILIANQITDPEKITALAYLAKSCTLTVCVDNEENVYALNKACAFANSKLHVLIEYEIGMKRCGIKEDNEVLALAKIVNSCENLVFDGIQAYAGHISHEIGEENRLTLTKANEDKIKKLLAVLAENGINVNILSGGSTGTSIIKAEAGLYTELQAGSYLFMDSTYGDLKLPFKNSLFVLSTVVSVKDGLVVVDAGVKSCGVDQGMPKPVSFTASEIVASEEHFQLHNPTKEFKVGDKVLLIPGHCCSTVNLHDKIYFFKGDKVTKRVFVTARGCSK